MVENIATQKSFEMPMRLVISSCFYEVKAYSPYITSLLNSEKVLNALGIEYTYYELSGDSYVDRAKNSLVNKFLKSDFSHILMIDSDLAWDIEGFANIIKAGLLGAEIVGGAYPNKNNWETFGAIPLIVDGKPVTKEVNGLRLMEMLGIPGGFILYSRKAFERTRENLNEYFDPSDNEALMECFKMHIQDNPYVREDGGYYRYIMNLFRKSIKDLGNYEGHNLNERFLECFRCNIELNGGRVGEDIYFQQRYREMGGTIWCEPNISFQHFGTKGWEGNFHKYLIEQDKKTTELMLQEILSKTEELVDQQEPESMIVEYKSAAEIGAERKEWERETRL